MRLLLLLLLLAVGFGDSRRLHPDDETAPAAPPPPHRPASKSPPPPPIVFPSPKLGPVALSTLHRWTSTGNGALLLVSLPMQWHATGAASLHALRALAISGWLSTCGVLLLLRELQVPAVRSWMRRHVRFATTPGGKRLLQIFGATLALTSGSPLTSLVGLATLSNFLFGRHVRKKVRSARKAAVRVFPRMVAAPAPPEEAEDAPSGDARAGAPQSATAEEPAQGSTSG